MKSANHGGARNGAGRKPKPEADALLVGSIRLTVAQWAKLASLGGISWMREQLNKLDVIESTISEHAVAGDRLRAAMRAYDTGRTMQRDSLNAINQIVGDPDNYVDAPSIRPISRA